MPCPMCAGTTNKHPRLSSFKSHTRHNHRQYLDIIYSPPASTKRHITKKPQAHQAKNSEKRKSKSIAQFHFISSIHSFFFSSLFHSLIHLSTHPSIHHSCITPADTPFLQILSFSLSPPCFQAFTLEVLIPSYSTFPPKFPFSFVRC